MNNQLLKKLLLASLIFGLLGGLVGFGINGTIQNACLWAGLGGVLPFILLIAHE